MHIEGGQDTDENHINDLFERFLDWSKWVTGSKLACCHNSGCALKIFFFNFAQWVGPRAMCFWKKELVEAEWVIVGLKILCFFVLRNLDLLLMIFSMILHIERAEEAHKNSIMVFMKTFYLTWWNCLFDWCFH